MPDTPPPLTQVVSYVGFDVLHGLVEQLSQSRDQLCDLRLCSVEEAEEKVERVHATALTALAQLFRFVTGTAAAPGGAAAAADGAGVGGPGVSPRLGPSKGPASAVAAPATTPAPVGAPLGDAAVPTYVDAELTAAVVAESIPAIRKQCNSKYYAARRSTYNFFGMLCTRAELVRPHLPEFTTTMLSFFDEKEPSNHEAMWAAVIGFIRCVSGGPCRIE